MLDDAEKKFPIHPPQTKEAYYYRSIFSDIYPSDEAALTVEDGPSIACSSPVAFRWSKEFEKMDDPSGRSVKIHQKSVDQV
jgi:asparagine synthase (glutamine-hydrolysing)